MCGQGSFLCDGQSVYMVGEYTVMEGRNVIYGGGSALYMLGEE